jgi:hypothetical protein
VFYDVRKQSGLLAPATHPDGHVCRAVAARQVATQSAAGWTDPVRAISIGLAANLAVIGRPTVPAEMSRTAHWSRVPPTLLSAACRRQ